MTKRPLARTAPPIAASTGRTEPRPLASARNAPVSDQGPDVVVPPSANRVARSAPVAPGDQDAEIHVLGDERVTARDPEERDDDPGEHEQGRDAERPALAGWRQHGFGHARKDRRVRARAAPTSPPHLRETGEPPEREAEPGRWHREEGASDQHDGRCGHEVGTAERLDSVDIDGQIQALATPDHDEIGKVLAAARTNVGTREYRDAVHFDEMVARRDARGGSTATGRHRGHDESRGVRISGRFDAEEIGDADSFPVQPGRVLGARVRR